MFLFRSLAIAALFFTTACSTVVEGRTQKVTVDSDPQGSLCLFKQADDVVGSVVTPGTADIPKSKNDLVIFCSHEGFESVSVKNRSDIAITSVGNMVLGQFSFLGNAVDSASGASNKYDSKMFVTLTAAQEPSAFPAPPGAPAVKQLPMDSLAHLAIQPPVSLAANTIAPTPAIQPSSANPSLHAAAALAQAANKAGIQQQVIPLTYAQATAEAPRRPPFDAIQ